MLFRRYDEISSFKARTLDVLLEHEVQNNLLLSLLDSRVRDASSWFLATVSDGGGVALTAICSKPFPMLLYETGNKPRADALELLAREVRRSRFAPPGAMAEPGLSRRFADSLAGAGAGKLHMKSSVMRLDALLEHKKAPGYQRTLEISDLTYAPGWERAFSEDCRSHVFTAPEYTERLMARLDKNTHFIWVDGAPVSQAVHGRDTPNGAVINGVYTPPSYRGRGYATSVVAALADALLNEGKPFCCLFADSDNHVSCGIYKKLGFYEVCSIDDIRFDKPEQIVYVTSG